MSRPWIASSSCTPVYATLYNRFRYSAAVTSPGLFEDARRFGAWWIVVLLLWILSLPAVTPRLYASDEIQYFAYLRSLWFDQDLSFDNEYRYFADRGIAEAYGFRETFLELTTETGRRINFATIGPAILWAPFYAVADGVARGMRVVGIPVAIDGFSRPYLAAVAYGSVFYGFLAVCLSIIAARWLLGRGHLAGVAVWLGTPLLFYMYLAPGMAHACSAFVVSLFVTTWLTVRQGWSTRGLITLGAVAALMAMVREQDVFFVVGPAIDYLWSIRDGWRSGDHTRVVTYLKRLAAGTVMAAVCYVPQVVAYLTLNGRIGPSSYVENKMVWFAPYAASVLISPQHGLFVWTPLVIVALAGVGLVLATGSARIPATQARRIAVCLLAMFAAQVYISGSVESWTVAGTFGQRRFVGTTIILVIGLAAIMQSSVRQLIRGAMLMTVVICMWWNLGLMAQFGAGLMDRQRLEPVRNAYNTFVVVPRVLPALAYRYLFDRPSFYQDPERYEDPPPGSP